MKRARRARLGHWPARTGDVVRSGEVLRTATLRFMRAFEGPGGIGAPSHAGPGAEKVYRELSAWVDRCSPAPATVAALVEAVRSCEQPVAIHRDVLARTMIDLEAYADARRKRAGQQGPFDAAESLKQACHADRANAAVRSLLRGQPVAAPRQACDEISYIFVREERARRPLFGAPRPRRKPREQVAMRLPETAFRLEVQEDTAREKRRLREEAEAVERARKDAEERQGSLFGAAPRTTPCTPGIAGTILVRAAIKAELLKKRECRLLYRRAYVQAAKAIELDELGGIGRVSDCDALERAREAFADGQRCERRTTS